MGKIIFRPVISIVLLSSLNKPTRAKLAVPSAGILQHCYRNKGLQINYTFYTMKRWEREKRKIMSHLNLLVLRERMATGLRVAARTESVPSGIPSPGERESVISQGRETP